MKRRSVAEENLKSQVATLEGYVESRDMAIRAQEHTIEALEAKLACADNEIATLKAHPLVMPRQRERLPDERESVAWTLRIGGKDDGTSCTVHIGFYPDGRVGEIFLRFNKQERGGHGAAMADYACTMMSIALQYGAPLEELVAKMIGASDESGGMTRVCADGEWTADPDVPMCRSLRDYLGKKLRARFCKEAA